MIRKLSDQLETIITAINDELDPPANEAMRMLRVRLLIALDQGAEILAGLAVDEELGRIPKKPEWIDGVWR